MDSTRTSRLVALVDLDGTLADYDAAIQRDMEPLWGPTEDRSVLYLPHQPPYIRARIKLIRLKPGWWRDLKPLSNGFDILGLLRKYDFALNILTKGPSSNSQSWAEKVQWCGVHVKDSKIHISEDKSLVYGKILFDDWAPYMADWLEYRPRGLGIMPATRFNEGFSHPNVVRYDGSNLQEVEERIIKLLAQQRNSL